MKSVVAALALISLSSTLPANSAQGAIKRRETTSVLTATTTVLSLTNPTPAYGAPVIITATVMPGGATGIVSFYDGVQLIGTAALTNETASITTSLLAPGLRSLAAIYGGDANFAASVSTAASVQVVDSIVGGFSAPITAATGQFPVSVAVADFNGDGNTDTVAVNQTDGTISVLLGIGNGSFNPAVTYTVGATPTIVVVADVNADGKPDIVVVNQGSNSISVLTGIGNGTFQAAVSYPAGLTPLAVAVGDFNADGYPDLAITTTGSPAGVSILLNNLAGGFAAPVTFATPTTPTGLIIGDFNVDGFTDLAVANGNHISIFLGNGDGTFGAATNALVGNTPIALGSADFNRDGFPDIAVTNIGSNNISILLGNGDGTFRAQVQYAAGTAPTSLVVADINGDFLPDLLVIDSGSGLLGVLLGNIDGTFQAMVSGPAGLTPNFLAASSFNNDALVDLVISNGPANTVSVLTGLGPSATLLSASPNPAAVGATVTMIATVTTTGATGTVTFLSDSVVLGTATLSGGFATFSTTALSQGTHILTATYGGNAVLAPSSATLNELIDLPTTTALAASSTTPLLGQAVTLTATVIGTGSTPTGRVAFFAGTALLGNATLVNGVATLKTSLLPSGSFAISANYTGDTTYLASVSNSVPATVTVTPGGGFQPPASYGTGTSPQAVVQADFNGDGIADLATANFAGNNVSVFLGAGNGTFSTRPSNPVGSSPIGIAAGDFNNDGHPDLIVSNYNGASLSLLLGNGDGTFQAAVTIALPTGALPLGITVADFNSDGQLDIAVVDAGLNYASILLGNGDGTFQASTAVTVGSGLKQIASADLNADGIPDLVVSGAAGASVLLGVGDGSFGAATVYPCGNGSTGILIANLNNDTAPDIAVVNSLDNTVSVLLGSGAGTFANSVAYPVGNFPQGVVAADFNGDGFMDLATSNEAGNTVSVLFGKGDGTFQSALSYAAGSSPIGLVAGAFNGTGQADLAVVSYQANTLGILLALRASSTALDVSPNPDPTGAAITLTATVSPAGPTGTITFYAGSMSIGTAPLTGAVGVLTVTVPAGNQSLTAVYSGDAVYGPSTSAPVVDAIGAIGTATTLTVTPSPAVYGAAVTLTSTVNNSAQGTVSFYNGATILGSAPIVNGSASLTTMSLPTGAQTTIARYNGSPNLASSVSPPVVDIITAQPGYSLSAAAAYGGGANPVSVTAADFNNDGKLDLAVASTGSSVGAGVLLGNGDGTFQTVTALLASSVPVQVKTADFNNDGKQDLAVANASGTVSILLGNGDGTFGNATNVPAGVQPSSLAIADFNHDGIPDLAVTSKAGGPLTILLGKGNGTFNGPQTTVVGVNNVFVVAGDFNGDGSPDIAIADAGSNSVWILLGKGDGTFQTPVQFAVGNGPTTIATADFNGDGKTDLAVCNLTDGSVSILLATGPGTFGTAIPYTSGSGSDYVAVGDFNGDGKPDLAVATQTGNVGIMIGNGDGSFKAPVPFAAGSSLVSLVVGNFNGNGKAQVAAASPSTNSVLVLLDGPPVLSIIQGNNQTTPAGSAFPNSLRVQATGYGYPATGVNVVFTAPSSGPGGLFLGYGAAANIITGSFGTALSPALVSNGTVGSFNVTASSGSVTATFNETTTTPVCGFVISPTSISVTNAGGSQAISVTPTGPSCSWGSSTTLPWVTLTNPTGTGNGTVNVTIPANTTGAERTGSILIAGQAVAVTEWATTQVFTDVPPSSVYFDAANLLYAKGITTGCSAAPLSFCPNSSILRSEAAIFIVRAVYGGDNFTTSQVPYFSDVPVGSFGFNWIQKMFELGITTGCGNGEFCPNATVSRAEMGIFIVRLRLGGATAFGYNPLPIFADVPVNGFGFQWIQRLAQDQITAGCGGDLFCPNDPISRGQMAVFIIRGGYNQLLPTGYPVITSVSPATIVAGTSQTITITGLNTNFAAGATSISPVAGLTFGLVTVINPTSLTVQVTASSVATPQPVSVIAVTGSVEFDVLPNGLVIQPATP